MQVQPGQNAESPPASFAIPKAGKYLITFQAAPNNTDRCQTFTVKRNGGAYAFTDAAGLGARFIVRAMDMTAASYTFSVTYFAAPPGGNNAACSVLTPMFTLQRIGQ